MLPDWYNKNNLLLSLWCQQTWLAIWKAVLNHWKILMWVQNKARIRIHIYNYFFLVGLGRGGGRDRIRLSTCQIGLFGTSGCIFAIILNWIFLSKIFLERITRKIVAKLVCFTALLVLAFVSAWNFMHFRTRKNIEHQHNLWNSVGGYGEQWIVSVSLIVDKCVTANYSLYTGWWNLEFHCSFIWSTTPRTHRYC